LLFSADAHAPRMNRNKMAGDVLTVCEQEMYRLLRISWALA